MNQLGGLGLGGLIDNLLGAIGVDKLADTLGLKKLMGGKQKNTVLVQIRV